MHSHFMRSDGSECELIHKRAVCRIFYKREEYTRIKIQSAHMSVRAQNHPVKIETDDIGGMDEAAANLSLGEGAAGFSGASADNPLKRNMVVSVRASLAELSAQSVKATWSPSQANLKAIFQQRQFVSLQGKSEMQGDLSQVVMHSVTANSVKSSFPVAVGAKMTGVDENTFSSQGIGYSMIVPANQHNNNATTLQRDDVSIGEPLLWPHSQRLPDHH